MKLRIMFSGLQMFAPRAATGMDPDTMHVVMPKATGHHGDERHLPVLVFDAAHLIRGSTSASGALVYKHLRDTVLTIGANSANLHLCPQIVNLRTVTRVPIDPAVLADDPRTAGVARVELRDGAMKRVAEGACWEWEYDRPRPMAHMAEWVIEGLDPASAVPLTLAGWHGNSPNPLPSLYPRGTGASAVIDLQIHHLPPADLPLEPEERHAPARGHEPGHFGAYYGLYAARVPEWRPRFRDIPGKCGEVTSPCPKLPADQGASPYNCMLAGDG